jgi:pimeloyl-ACP methyl ester carboxylesterase
LIEFPVKPLAVAVLLIGLLLLAGWLGAMALGASMASRFPPVGRIIDLPGRKVHLWERGQGDVPPQNQFLLIHGASGNLMEMTAAFETILPANAHLLAVDRPGHGYSERLSNTGDADLGVQAKVLVQTMDASSMPHAVVIGHSFGGALALRLALDHPEKVAALILVAPVSHPWPGGIAWYYRVSSVPVIGSVFARAIAPLAGYLTLEQAVEGIFVPAKAPPGYSDKIGAGLVLRPATFEANALDVAYLYDQIVEQSKRYGAIKVPVLIMTSDQDTVVSPTIHAKTLAAMLDNAELQIIAGTGHAPHHLEPKRMAALIDAFLAKAFRSSAQQNEKK